MTNFLIKKFIKDPEVRSSYGKLGGKVGIVCNVLLCIAKFTAGIFSGSLSISADAVNNLSDASSSIISLIGFKLSEKTPDREHPYGHGRYEYLAGFTVAALIIVIGAELFRSSILKIIDPAEVTFGVLPVAALALSIIVKLWLMGFYLKLSRIISSEVLKASAMDSRNDVFSTTAVLIALIITHFSGINLDGIMGAAVAVAILISGIGLVRDAMDTLLGKAPSREVINEIRQKILAYDGVLGTHDLMIHDYGPGRVFASVHVEVSADMGLLECHELIDTIERDFSGSGLNLLVHPDPIADENTAAGKAAAEISGIVKRIDERITVHDIRTVGALSPKSVSFDCVLPQDLERGDIEERIFSRLREKYPDCAVEITFDFDYDSVRTSDTNL